jgi:hypothetical protein
MFTSKNTLKSDNCTEYSIATIARSLEPGLSYSSFEAWSEVVKEYTSRNLSFQSDRLPALSGIINLLHSITRDICYAGIWRKRFWQGLSWRLQRDSDRYVAVPKTPRRNPDWTGPTWSFAAVDGVVLYDEFDSSECAELEECRVVPLEASFARIKASLTTISDIECEPDSHGRSCKIATSSRVLEAHVYLDFEYHASCEAIMIAPDTGLAVTMAEGKQGTYVRIGVVHVNTSYQVRQEDMDWPTARILVIV